MAHDPGVPAERRRRPKISLQGRIIAHLARLMAPDRSGPGALEAAIAEDRRQGPAMPSRKVLRRLKVDEVQCAGLRAFRARPASGSVLPLRLLYLHGGAYVMDLKAIQWNLVDGLVQRIPAEVMAPVYPLAPESGWEDGLAAVERAFDDVAAEVGPARVVVVGDSAGGGLALSLAQRLRDGGKAPPAALALFSPWLDLSVTGEDQPALERRDPVLTIDFLRAAGRMWAKDLPTTDPRVSPLFGDVTGLPPTIVFSGTRDVLDSDALRLAAADPQIVHHHYPEMMHVWPCAPMPEGRRALDEAAAFIRRHAVA